MSPTHLGVVILCVIFIGVLLALQIKHGVDPGPDEPGDDRIRRAIDLAMTESRKWARKARLRAVGGRS